MPKLFSFHGRTNRLGYFMICLLPGIILTVAVHVLMLSMLMGENDKIKEVNARTAASQSLSPEEPSNRKKPSTVTAPSSAPLPEKAEANASDIATSSKAPANVFPVMSLLHWTIIAFVLLYGWIYYAATVRRLHDLGQTGFISLVMFIPIANLLAWLWLLFAKGQAGDNRFGPPTKPKPQKEGLV